MRLLYIDDDPALGLLVRRRLKRHGIAVSHAINGDQGMETLAREGADVIALDHTMPGETGLAVLLRLRALENPPPVVYVTGSSDAHVAVEALKSGASDYVMKSISDEFYDLLQAALTQAVDRRRLEQQKAETERAVRQARDRAEMLLHEVNHRIANSLGLVGAMVRMQASVISDPVALEVLKETQNRIAAVAGVHRRLYASETVGQVEANDYLSHLTHEIEASYRDSARPHHIRLSAEPIMLTTDRAVSLGVAVTELLTNAYKYAYPQGDAGEIRVHLWQDDQTVCVAVEDDGQGHDPDGPCSGTGLGKKILASMATTLNGTYQHDGAYAGTRIVLRFPLEAEAAR
jgi:two-component sensor histidine kinase/CheY-like chemotaxis protein